MTTPETPKRSNQEELARIYELLERAEKSHKEWRDAFLLKAYLQFIVGPVCIYIAFQWIRSWF